MTRRLITAFASLVLTCGLTSTTNAANSWGLDYEEEKELKAKVVDIACELTGNCPADCGGGTRQLGLVTDDGTLIPAVKGATLFTGATEELLEYCGKIVHVDGLYLTNPAMHMYFVQRIKLTAEGKWKPASKWRKNWSARNPDIKKGKWFREDPLIKQILAKDGILGIPGLEYTEE